MFNIISIFDKRAPILILTNLWKIFKILTTEKWIFCQLLAALKKVKIFWQHFCFFIPLVDHTHIPDIIPPHLCQTNIPLPPCTIIVMTRFGNFLTTQLFNNTRTKYTEQIKIMLRRFIIPHEHGKWEGCWYKL